MFISNSRRFIFVHLHKAGGTSVEVALSSTLRWNDILLGSTKEGEQLQRIYRSLFDLSKHSCASRIRAVVGPSLWDSYFTFATVRNPYALAVSQFTYSWRNLALGLRRADRAVALGAPLDRRAREDWPWKYPGVLALMSLNGLDTRFSDFLRAIQLDDWSGFAPQKRQLCDDAGALLVKRVVRLERLEADWPDLCQALGVADVPLVRENVSWQGGPGWPDYYGAPEDRVFVRERFAEDFSLFDYPDAPPQGWPSSHDADPPRPPEPVPWPRPSASTARAVVRWLSRRLGPTVGRWLARRLGP